MSSRHAAVITPESIHAEAYGTTSEAIAAQRSPAGIAAMAAAAAASFDRIWTVIRGAVERQGSPFECRSGCAACCNQLVAAAPAEVIALARHVEASFSPAQLLDLKRRLAALDDRSRGLGAFARGYLKTPCALLVDGKCSAYEARPVRCRSVYSRDVTHCRWVAENPDVVDERRDEIVEPRPYPPEPEVIADAILSALSKTAHEAGLGVEFLELTAGLRIALDTPDAAEAYLRGDEVFAAAVVPDSPDAGL
jgi:uncharacterized protein